MYSIFVLAFLAVGTLFLAPLVWAQNLSSYRQFRLESDLVSVAKQTGMKPSDAKAIHSRPALIQELQWYPNRTLGASSRTPDSVEELLFSFYNGELFQIVIRYDRERTKGLTEADLVEAISAERGVALKLPGKTITFSSTQVYNDTETVIARWEDAQYSFNLYRSSYKPTFGMVVFSKQLDILARAAVATAIRLDEQEAPQREIERQNAAARENRIDSEKARMLNKPIFRP
jgi:hypothetical protein